MFPDLTGRGLPGKELFFYQKIIENQCSVGKIQLKPMHTRKTKKERKKTFMYQNNLSPELPDIATLSPWLPDIMTSCP